MRYLPCCARRVGWGRRPVPSPGSACSAAIVATRRWNRVSPASSGWNEVAITLRSRTATIRPSSSVAMTSTPRTHGLDHGGPDEHRVDRRVAEDRHAELRLERVELAAERVALHAHVEQRQDRLLAALDLLAQHDHPGARPEQRLALGGEGEDRLGEAPAGDQAAHRRGLAARDDQPVDVLELLRQAHLDGLHADRVEGGDMLCERPLEGEDSDLHRAGGCRRVPAYQPRTAIRSWSGISSSAIPRIGAPRPLLTSAMIEASW